MHSPTLYQMVNFGLLMAACLAAAARGGAGERLAGAAMLLAWIASPLAQNVNQRLGMQVGLFVIDSLLLTVLVFVALRSDRWWPMWACAFHAVGTLIHVLAALDVEISPRAYFIGSGLLSYLTMGALLLGALNRPRPRPGGP